MKSGFTLIELIIVIVLIAILSIAVGPKIFTSGYKQSADQIKFATIVRYAQHEAMVRGGGVCIEFRDKSHYYYVEDSSSNKILVPGEKSENIQVQESINSSVSPICFDFIGEPVYDNGSKIMDNTTIVVDGKKVVVTPIAGGVILND